MSAKSDNPLTAALEKVLIPKPTPPSKILKFYGTCDTCFKLDDVVWRAVEDPSDGYRSMLAKIERVADVSTLTFSSVPFALVQCRAATADSDGSGLDGYELFDALGHVWLRCIRNPPRSKSRPKPSRPC